MSSFDINNDKIEQSDILFGPSLFGQNTYHIVIRETDTGIVTRFLHLDGKVPLEEMTIHSNTTKNYIKLEMDQCGMSEDDYYTLADAYEDSQPEDESIEVEPVGPFVSAVLSTKEILHATTYQY